MALACETGSPKLDIDAVLELPRVKVVKATKEPTEVTELKGALDEVLGIEELEDVVVEFKEDMRIVLEEGAAIRLDATRGLYIIEDVFDEMLRFKPIEGGCSSVCSSGCGCKCGYGCLVGTLELAVGIDKEVWLPNTVGRTWRGLGKLWQESAMEEEESAASPKCSKLENPQYCHGQRTAFNA